MCILVLRYLDYQIIAHDSSTYSLVSLPNISDVEEYKAQKSLYLQAQNVQKVIQLIAEDANLLETLNNEENNLNSEMVKSGVDYVEAVRKCDYNLKSRTL